MRDFNIDLLKKNNTNVSYSSIMQSHDFHLCNNDDTATRELAVLDHLYTNNLSLDISMQHLKYHLLDHNIVIMAFAHNSISEDQNKRVRDSPISRCTIHGSVWKKSEVFKSREKETLPCLTSNSYQQFEVRTSGIINYAKIHQIISSKRNCPIGKTK